jgi:hypothetical protein
VVEVGTGGEDSAEEERGVDGGDLAIAPGLAGFDVVEVEEEAVLIGEDIAVEAQGTADLFEDLRGGIVGTLVGDAEGGETEAGGGDAGHPARVERAGAVDPLCAIEHLSGARAGLFGEVETAAALDVVEEGFIRGDEGLCSGSGREDWPRPDEGRG